jgi:transcriptional regulator with XRE-family HTH domain
MASRSVILRSCIPPQTVGDRIKLRRQELGLTQRELEQRLGPSFLPGDVMRLETYRTLMPSWTRLVLLAQALEVPTESLLSRTLPLNSSSSEQRSDAPSAPMMAGMHKE